MRMRLEEGSHRNQWRGTIEKIQFNGPVSEYEIGLAMVYGTLVILVTTGISFVIQLFDKSY